MNDFRAPRVTLIIGTLLSVSGAILLAFATPGIVSGTAPQQIEPFSDYACLDCHTDRERLTELAPVEAEEEEESLSSGPG